MRRVLSLASLLVISTWAVAQDTGESCKPTKEVEVYFKAGPDRTAIVHKHYQLGKYADETKATNAIAADIADLVCKQDNDPGCTNAACPVVGDKCLPSAIPRPRKEGDLASKKPGQIRPSKHGETYRVTAEVGWYICNCQCRRPPG